MHSLLYWPWVRFYVSCRSLRYLSCDLDVFNTYITRIRFWELKKIRCCYSTLFSDWLINIRIFCSLNQFMGIILLVCSRTRIWLYSFILISILTSLITEITLIFYSCRVFVIDLWSITDFGIGFDEGNNWRFIFVVLIVIRCAIWCTNCSK